MKLIFKNCMKYNTPDTPFYKDAEKLLRKTDNHLVKNRRDYEKTLKKLANDLTKGQVKHINSGGSNSGAIPASASKTNSGSSARSTPKSTPKVGSMVIKFKMPSMVDEEGPILATPKISFETSQLNDGSQARKRKDDIGGEQHAEIVLELTHRDCVGVVTRSCHTEIVLDLSHGDCVGVVTRRLC